MILQRVREKIINETLLLRQERNYRNNEIPQRSGIKYSGNDGGQRRWSFEQNVTLIVFRDVTRSRYNPDCARSFAIFACWKEICTLRDFFPRRACYFFDFLSQRYNAGSFGTLAEKYRTSRIFLFPPNECYRIRRREIEN